MSQQINLYNPQFEHKKQLLTAPGMAGLLLALALVLVGVGGFSELRTLRLQAAATAGAGQLAAAQKRLAQVNVEFAPRAKDARLVAELDEADAEHLALQRVGDAIARGDLGDTRGYGEVFRALARQHVEGLWLTGVSVAGGGNEIGIRGRTLDATLVPGYLARLRNEPVLQGKAVGNMQIGQAAAVKVRSSDGKETETPAPYVEFALGAAPTVAAPGGQP